ncbi:MAG: thymidine phosphorylase [Polyangiaceae bacterium]|nr:thymidine phosphorylase [Polyangiaceae bacterium]
MTKARVANERSAPVPDAVELIVRKRDQGRLEPAELKHLVEGYTAGRVADYQMSAWLMASLLNGLDESETVALTDAMLHSGRVLELGSVHQPKVDKHSTGGVGDKVSLCLGPLVASCGVAVPMVSGRGLGHTGGTLDKLEAIEGYDTRLDARRFERVVATVGVSIIGQTSELAPADKRIYALRDVTGTVESVPLIVASILSKKLAEGIDALLLDVKVGRGAFMKDLDSARLLGRTLVRVGRRFGKRVSAVLTDMEFPLGRTIGNALEVEEAIDVLRNEGPDDTRELTLDLGARMLVLGGAESGLAAARRRVERTLASGEALECFARMVRAHGGNTRVIEHPEMLPKAPVRVAVPAPRSGFLVRCDALELGLVAVRLGAGRLLAEDAVDPAAGIELAIKPGDRVAKGQPMAWLCVRRRAAATPWLARAAAAFTLGPRPPPARPLVLENIAR